MIFDYAKLFRDRLANAKSCFLHNALDGKKNGVHQTVQERSREVFVSTPLISVLYLSGNLKVADNLCIEANRDFEQVTDTRSSFIFDEILFKTPGRTLDQVKAFEDLSGEVSFGVVVDFGAVAR